MHLMTGTVAWKLIDDIYILLFRFRPNEQQQQNNINLKYLRGAVKC